MFYPLKLNLDLISWALIKLLFDFKSQWQQEKITIQMIITFYQFISLFMIWAWCFLDFLFSLLIDWIFLSFYQNQSDPKVIISTAKKNIHKAKSISELSPERFAFRPEFVRIEKMVWEQVQKYDMMTTHQDDGSKERCSDSLLAYILSLLIC